MPIIGWLDKPTARPERDTRDRAPEDRPSRGRVLICMNVALTGTTLAEAEKDKTRRSRIAYFWKNTGEEKKSGDFAVARSVRQLNQKPKALGKKLFFEIGANVDQLRNQKKIGRCPH